jgi:hypothetical protein
MINTSDLIPSHNCLRNPFLLDTVLKDKTYFDNIINNQKNKIIINRTEDGKLYIMDGHHRLCGIHFYYGEVNPSDVIIKDFTYRQINEFNFAVGYLTPFDIMNECRLPYFWEFKSWLNSHTHLVEQENFSIDRIKKFYCEKRISKNLDDLIINSK